jgi:hypothetical protein
VTQGYGVDHAKSSTLRSTGLHRYATHCGQESTGAESSARALPTIKTHVCSLAEQRNWKKIMNKQSPNRLALDNSLSRSLVLAADRFKD